MDKSLYLLIGSIKPLDATLQLYKTRQNRMTGSLSSFDKMTEQYFTPSDYPHLYDILAEFLRSCEMHPKNKNLVHVSLALSGPVVDQNCNLSFLNWNISNAEMKAKFGFQSVLLLNDVESTAFSVMDCVKNDLHIKKFKCISFSDQTDPNAPALLVNLDNGIGKSLIIGDEHNRTVIAGESSHADFVPRNLNEFNLKNFIHIKFKMERVEVENVISGMGIDTIYCYLSSIMPKLLKEEISDEIKKSKRPGSVVSSLASKRKDLLSRRTINFFLHLLAADLRNTALRFLPYGGIFITGESVPQIASCLERNEFMKSFIDDENGLLHDVAVFVQDKPGNLELRGARKTLTEKLESDTVKKVKNRIVTWSSLLFVTVAAIGIFARYNGSKRKI